MDANVEGLKAAKQNMLARGLSDAYEGYLNSLNVKSGIGNEGARELQIPEPPKPASLSDVDARKWYLENEPKIPSLLDKTKPLEQQAKQAVELRNQFRTQARAAMTNRVAAEALDITDPNQTCQMLVDKYSAKGLSGDDLYREVIKAAQRSRTSVNHMLGID